MEFVRLNDLGVSQMGQYQYSDAFDSFSKVVEEYPGWDVATVNLAIAILNRQDTGDEQLAIDTLSNVIARNPTNVRAQYTSGIIQLYLGHAAEAIEHLEIAHELDSSDAYTTYFLGQASLQTENYQQAQDWFLKTLDLNPSLRSAYWAAATASRRVNEVDKSLELIDQYQGLEHNPLSVTAGFSYRQMGPKAEAMSVIRDKVEVAVKPQGSLFKQPIQIDIGNSELGSLTVHDVDSDLDGDIVASGAQGIWFIETNLDNEMSFEPISVFSQEFTNSLMFGDMDNDGTTELITCDSTGMSVNSIVDQRSLTPMTVSTSPCSTGRVVDADHDGDLDLISMGSEGLRVIHNKLDGSYELLNSNVALNAVSVKQLVVLDIDVDRDADFFVVGVDSSNSLWLNDLTWEYVPQSIPSELANRSIQAATFGDLNVDGYPELILALQDGLVESWTYSKVGNWSHEVLVPKNDRIIHQLDAQDFDGDGSLDLLLVYGDGFEVMSTESRTVLSALKRQNLTYAISYVENPANGPSLLTLSAEGLELWSAGEGRYPSMAIQPSGKTSADQMRSNASGIGTWFKLRNESRWSIATTYPTHSGTSQSLQPMTFGSGGSANAEYLEILWTDGVSQTETDLKFGQLHQIEEIQRQLASCPVVFAWNGEKYEFITDILGVAALGLYAAAGETVPFRPFERFQFKDGTLKPRQGFYEIKIGEPMEEILYLDAASLWVYDIPQDVDMVLDERLNVYSDTPTGKAIYFKESIEPKKVINLQGIDVSSETTKVDLIAPSPGKVDSRFIGLMDQEHGVVLEFGNVLPRENLVLVADGWMEYPYSQTVHSAIQAGVTYKPPSLEARDNTGTWYMVAEQFGYPAGMPRVMSLPIEGLPENTEALRITSNMEIYWDRLRLVVSDPTVDVEPVVISPNSGSVKTARFSLRTTGPQRTPYYDYDQRSTYWDAKYAEGNYSATGNVLPLVEETDSSVAIIGSGEEVHLTFKKSKDVEPGFKRIFVLDVRGWAKDMDLYTESGHMVEPIPKLENMTPEQLANRTRLHDRYNVRFQSGMVAQ